MSSYEDVYGMAASLFEALKHVQWKGPHQWELESFINPIPEQLLFKLSQSQHLVANPTLAAPTNIRMFMTNTCRSIQDPIQLATFVAFLLFVPFFSTIFVAMFTNINIALKVLGLPLARNPVKASPVAVILFVITIFGNIPLVDFFPVRATNVQAFLPVQPGQYRGVIAWVLQFAALYEIIELVARVSVEIMLLVRYRSTQLAKLLQPTSITSWLFTIAGFALRMWFTRVSTDTATSPVQSGSTVWMWSKIILRTDLRYQSPEELNDDLVISLLYFATTYCLSSLLVHYMLTPKHEVYQPLEPTIVKVTASASIQTASAACQTIVTGEDWVTKSSIAEDAEHIRKIQVVIDRELKKVDNFLATWFDAVQKSSEKLKEQTLQWQNDHTALSTNLAVLKGFRNILDQHKEDVQKTRQLTDRVSAKVKRLEQTIEQKEKAHQADLQSYEKKYQECRKEVDELIGKIGVLAKGNDGGIATLVNTDTKEASKLDANLGPREAESQSVSANTPELQKTLQTSVTVQCTSQSDSKASEDPTLPSPPLSPPNLDDPNSSEKADGDKKQETTATCPKEAIADAASPIQKAIKTQPESSDSTAPPAEGVSAALVERDVEPEKTSDSEMDPTSVGSDNEVVEEIGADVWSRVQQFKFRKPDAFAVPMKDIGTRRHFTMQEIEKIIALLIDFRDNVANENQRAQVSTIFDAGFPHQIGILFKPGVDLLSVFLDIAELKKQFTRERIFTELPAPPYAYASGVHPQRIGMINGRRDWRVFRTRLEAMTDQTLDMCSAQYKDALQADVDKVRNNIARSLGERPQLWDRNMFSEVAKTNRVWDMNLIARRLLENFGLLEFREKTTEGTSTEEYVLALPPIPTPPVKAASSETSGAETPCVPPSTEVTSIDTTSKETPSVEAPSVDDILTTPMGNETPIIAKSSSAKPAPVERTSIETFLFEASCAACSDIAAMQSADRETSPAQTLPIPISMDTPSTLAPSVVETTGDELPNIEGPVVPPVEAVLVEPDNGKTPSVEVPCASAPVENALVEQIGCRTPVLEAPLAELSAPTPTRTVPGSIESSSFPLPANTLQPQSTSAIKSPISPSESTPFSFDLPTIPTKPSFQSSTPFIPLTLSSPAPSASSPSTVTPTRAAPSKTTAPDWRQEALQDKELLQQQMQRPGASGPHRNNRRKSQGKNRSRGNA